MIAPVLTPRAVVAPETLNLPPSTPIEPVMVPGFGNDFGGGSRDPIAARGRIAGHADDQGLFAGGKLDRAADQLGGDDGTAGRIDAEDHGADAVVLAGGLERINHVVRVHRVRAGRREGIDAAAAVLDIADAVDDRDFGPMGEHPGGDGMAVAIVVDELMALAAIMAHPVVELILIFEAVEQLGLEAVVGGERGAVNDGADGVGGEVAMGC